MLGLHVERPGGLRRDLPNAAISDVLDALDQVRRERDAVVGDHGDGRGLLYRRERVVSLADTRRDRVSKIPLVVEALALPRTRRQHADELAFDVDAGLVSEAELRHERVGVVDVGVAGQHVVVRVAGNDDRFGHIDVAVSARLVVAESMRGPRDLIEAGVEDGLARGALARSQRRQREVGLDGRARWIGAPQRAIEHRLVRRFVEEVPVRGVDAVDEKIGIEARLGHEREDVAGRGLDRHQRATPVAKRGLGGLLQLDIQRELQVVARNRRRAR